MPVLSPRVTRRIAQNENELRRVVKLIEGKLTCPTYQCRAKIVGLVAYSLPQSSALGRRYVKTTYKQTPSGKRRNGVMVQYPSPLSIEFHALDRLGSYALSTQFRVKTVRPVFMGTNSRANRGDQPMSKRSSAMV